MKRIIILSIAGTLAGMPNLTFGMQQTFNLPDGKTMFFNLSNTYLDPYTKVPIAATYIPKRRNANLLPVLALVKVEENPPKWELLTPDGLETMLQSNPNKLNDVNYLKNNIYFFVYDEKTSKNGTFLCDGVTVFKSAGNETAQAYRNLVLGKYSPACTTKTPGCDIAKLDHAYKFAADQKTILQPVDVMKKSVEVIEKNDGKMYTFLKSHLLKYSSLSSQPTLRDFDYANKNDALYATLLYKNIRGQESHLPMALHEDLAKSGFNTKVLVLIDTKGTMTGVIIYTIVTSGSKSVIAVNEIIAKPENKKLLYDLFEKQMKQKQYKDIVVDTAGDQTPAEDIAFFKQSGFTENEKRKTTLVKKV